MNSRIFFLFILFFAISIFLGSCSSNKSIELYKNQIRLVNRMFDTEQVSESNIIALDAQESSGLAILENIQFTTGTIELDILGEDKPGKSFVGLAFNIQNDSTYEAVYFRPFNFHSPEQIRREHGMQYIFHPEYPWHRLRKEKEGQFESIFENPPAPDDWFRVRIIIDPEKVKVEDPRSGVQLMQVNRLTEARADKIGFWTGFGSKGSFRKLSIAK